ncbi:hypothetical protein TNCT_109001 [Trichonephila clavata]|uniref:Uncharacterized protein n=1 Tax=Trichonephila clavata TaxID=2740835 RepID=A0A8X6H3F6_TRICU|nr:hypothetical protein TNCT_109001 [Trichonephila clavata]
MRQLFAVTPSNPIRNVTEAKSFSYGDYLSQRYYCLHENWNLSKKVDLFVIDTELPYIIPGLEYLHLFKLGISISKMSAFQFGKNSSNVRYANSKCVNELRTYHGTNCKPLNNDQIMSQYHESNINFKGNKDLDEIPDSPEADL